MKRARAVLSAMLLLCGFMFAAPVAAPVAASAAEPLIVAVNGPYRPFVELDEQGNLGGFDVDIALAVCRSIGRECRLINLEHEDVIPAIVDGRADIAVAGLGVTPERKKLVDFTDRYYRSVSIFIERKGTFKALDPKALKGRRIGAQRSSMQEDYLIATYGDSITLVTHPSYEAIFEMLKNKEVDLVLSDGLPGYAYLSSEEGEKLETIGAPLDAGGPLDWACIALGKNREDLKTAINQAILALRRSGEYDRINRKYFEFSIY